MNDYLTTTKAAKRLNINPATVRRWVRKYPAIGCRIGGWWHVNPAAIDAISRGVPLDEVARG